MIGVIEGDQMTSTRADPHSKTVKPLATSCSPDALARLEKTRDETVSVFLEASQKLIEAKAVPKED
jgi:hypothetical protein